MSKRVLAARTIVSRTQRVSHGEYDGNRKRQATTNACAFARFGSSLIDRPLFSSPFTSSYSSTFSKSISYSLRLSRHHTRRVLLALILAASYSPTLAASYPLSFSPPAPSLTSYTSRCIVQFPAVCHSESCANHVTKLAIILAASYLQSYSPHLTCNHTRRVLLAIILAAGTLIDIVLVTLYCTTSHCLSL